MTYSKIKTSLLLITIILSIFCYPVFSHAAVTISTEYPETEAIDAVKILPHPPLDNPDNIEDSFIFTKVIPFAIDYGIKLAIGLSVVVLIFGGYEFITAYGNSERHKKAKRTVTYALIGLILALTAYGIVVILTSLNLS